jgi:hypothetical protein
MRGIGSQLKSIQWMSGTTIRSIQVPVSCAGTVLRSAARSRPASSTARARQSGERRTSASVKRSHSPVAASPIRWQPHCLPFHPSGSGAVGSARTRPSRATSDDRIAGVRSVLWSS